MCVCVCVLKYTICYVSGVCVGVRVNGVYML